MINSGNNMENKPAQQHKLTITYLYPVSMSTYGDRGNVLTLLRRAEWRGIAVHIKTAEIGERIPVGDLYFFGGGQDHAQIVVAQDLAGEKSAFLRAEAEAGKVMLAICGGYQLLGTSYTDGQGNVLPGVGILDARTVAGAKRMIGDIAVMPSDEFAARFSREQYEASGRAALIIGFENHSGKTFIGHNAKPFARVQRGSGNNGEDGTEGALYKNVLGCYMHGSLLPKNPHLADFLISTALAVKEGKPVPLSSLDDNIEWAAHDRVLSAKFGL